MGGHWTKFLFVMIKTFIGGLSRLLDHDSISHIGLKTKGTQGGRFLLRRCDWGLPVAGYKSNIHPCMKCKFDVENLFHPRIKLMALLDCTRGNMPPVSARFWTGNTTMNKRKWKPWEMMKICPLPSLLPSTAVGDGRSGNLPSCVLQFWLTILFNMRGLMRVIIKNATCKSSRILMQSFQYFL